MLSPLDLNDPNMGWDALRMIAVGGFVLVVLATVLKTVSKAIHPHPKLDGRQAMAVYAISAILGMGFGSITLAMLLAITWAMLHMVAQRYVVSLGLAAGLGTSSVIAAVQSAALALDFILYGVEKAVQQEQVTLSGVTRAVWAEATRGVFAWAKAHAQASMRRSLWANIAAAAIFLAAAVLHQRGTFLEGFALLMFMLAGVLAITYSLPAILATAANYMHTNSWGDGAVSLWGSFLLAVTLAANAFVVGAFNQAPVPPSVFLLLVGFNLISSTISSVASAARREREAQDRVPFLAEPPAAVEVSNTLTGDVHYIERATHKATRFGRGDW